MHYTKVIALVMTTVGLMAPAVAAPVPHDSLVSRQQDNGANGHGPHQYCEPLGACAGIPKRQQDFINIDPDLYGKTGGIGNKRQQDNGAGNGPHEYCEPLGTCAGIEERQQDLVDVDPDLYGKTAGIDGKRQDSISGSPLSNPETDDPLNWDPDLWGNQGGIVNKRDDDPNPDDCNPKSECGGPMGMRPGPAAAV